MHNNKHIDESEEQDEICSQRLEKQQEYRRKQITHVISVVVRVIDIFWQANQRIIKDSTQKNKTNANNKKHKTNNDKNNNDNNNTKTNSSNCNADNVAIDIDEPTTTATDKDNTQEKKSDTSNSVSNLKLARRVSLLKVSKSKHPLTLDLFHGSGLNEQETFSSSL